MEKPLGLPLKLPSVEDKEMPLGLPLELPLVEDMVRHPWQEHPWLEDKVNHPSEELQLLVLPYQPQLVDMEMPLELPFVEDMQRHPFVKVHPFKGGKESHPWQEHP